MELVGLCDEVAVLYEGTIVDRLTGPALTEERLVRASVMGTGTGTDPDVQRVLAPDADADPKTEPGSVAHA
ncbi:hypothetical protein [Streptomyces canus]|uniref:hypothetical protein n=1 Tax=Streptomyces canus TaxID=58343 RepID=UPI0037FCD30C